MHFPQSCYRLWAAGTQDERREVTRTWRGESEERRLEKGSGLRFRDTASLSPPLREGLGDLTSCLPNKLLSGQPKASPLIKATLVNLLGQKADGKGGEWS